MNPITISKITARRFIMGKQGLWPGRRFTGLAGTTAAIREMEALQLDPLNVIARSQDIAMFGRVLDYRPADLATVAYERRKFFDFGGTLFLYPMDEVPYWRLYMQRARQWRRQKAFADEHPDVLAQVKNDLRENGPMSNRDFKGNKRVANHYRGRKDTAIALYYLWITGEVMIHHRNGFDRVYDLTENILPAAFAHTASEAESEAYFSRKAVSFRGLIRDLQWRNSLSNFIQRKVGKKEADERIAALYEQGMLMPVKIQNSKERWIALASDLPLLEELDAGRVPGTWQPLCPSTQDEVTFVAPLEIVSARGRAKRVFDFEYIWEVYKPVEKRRWGYYVLPILYGDDLVARLDPKLDRSTMTLEIKGFWLEDNAPVNDIVFADALGRGLARFARFVDAKQVDVEVIAPQRLREHVKRFLSDD